MVIRHEFYMSVLWRPNITFVFVSPITTGSYAVARAVLTDLTNNSSHYAASVDHIWER